MGDALGIQIGGNHYKDLAIQPVEYTMRNGLSFLQGCIIKRITRYNRAGGNGLLDLEKIKHEIDLIVELEGITHPSPLPRGEYKASSRESEPSPIPGWGVK